MLGFRVQQLQGRIATQKIRSAQVLWAQGKTSPQIGSERDRLKGELPAPRDFLATNLRFSGFLAEMPAVLPRTAWLLSLETVDQLWSDKPDRHRGRRYAVLEAAAPFARPGDVDETLAALEHSALFRAQLPLAKITTFESQGQGDAGQTLFTIQCLPKGGALLEPSASSGGKETAKKETAKKK